MKEKNLSCWNATISCLRTLKKGADAYDMLRLMRRDGVEPNLITLSEVMVACEGSQDWALADDAYEQYKKLGIRPRLAQFRVLLKSAIHQEAGEERIREILSDVEKWKMELTPEIKQYVSENTSISF